MARELSRHLPYPLIYKVTAKTNKEITDIVKQANFDGECAGIITWCHTFSPSKMWINGLGSLQKPYCHLGIGMNEKDPARLVDMGGRMRLICQDIVCVKPIMPMPNLPVARVMWKPMPSLAEGVECWITAGGAHHTVLSYDVTAPLLRDLAKLWDIEFVHITRDTTVEALEKELLLSDLAWKLK